ncbi:MAG: glycosyltransferase family 2 protein [Arenicella sp.]|nr:glycosyltransferase family 2 protein [Arenicella sp.]
MTSSRECKPIIAIVTPSYNRAASLGRAIDSVLSQAYPYWRLIVVDDGSTDNSSAMIDTYTDERIMRLRIEHNRGHLAARNLALDHLPGDADWITELDSDDYFLPEALSVMVEKLEQLPKVKNFRFGSQWENGDSACGPVDPGQLVEYETKISNRAPRGEWVVLMHRCFRDQGMRFNEKLRRTPNVALHLRIYQQGPVAHFPDVLRVMSKTEGSITRPIVKDKRYYLEQIAVHKVFFEQFGDDLKELDLLRYKKRLTSFKQDCELAHLPLEQWPEFLKSVD